MGKGPTEGPTMGERGPVSDALFPCLVVWPPSFGGGHRGAQAPSAWDWLLLLHSGRAGELLPEETTPLSAGPRAAR